MHEESWRPLTVEEARALGWQPYPHGCGTVTQACDEWLITSSDQRAYLRLTLPWMAERFEAEWQSILHSPADEDGPETFDIFESRVGMSMLDWEWMTLAAVIRDAVTAYEVYVVKGFQEVARRHGRGVGRDQSLPKFAEAQKGCLRLGLQVRPTEVNDVFQLRNVLTHQRGQLRTQREREQHSEAGDSVARVAHLTEAKVLQYVDVLDAAVHVVDPVLWAYSWGSQVAPPLLRG